MTERPAWIVKLTNEQLRHHIGDTAIDAAHARADLQQKEAELAELLAEADARAGCEPSPNPAR